MQSPGFGAQQRKHPRTVSVVVCARDASVIGPHRANVAASVGCDHEYVPVDNTGRRYGLCAAYNEGARRAGGDVLAFVHDDVFFVGEGWGRTLLAKLTDPTVGLVGVAGTQYLGTHPRWTDAGRPFLRGRVLHELDGGRSCALSLFSRERGDAEVVALDGLFLALRRELLEQVRFDDAVFDQFDFYDLDLCMQVRRTHRVIVTTDILVRHRSGGERCHGLVWEEQARRFVEKHRSRLPASCVTEVPDLDQRVPFEHFNMYVEGPRVVRT